MTVLAVTKVENTNIFSAIDGIFQKLVAILEKIIFFDIAGFPLIVLWLILGAILLTFRMGFINIRGFKHAIDIVMIPQKMKEKLPK